MTAGKSLLEELSLDLGERQASRNRRVFYKEQWHREVGLYKVYLRGILRYLAVSASYVGSNEKLRCKDRLWPRSDFRTLYLSFQKDLKLFSAPILPLKSIWKASLFPCCLKKWILELLDTSSIKPWRNLGPMLHYLIKYFHPIIITIFMEFSILEGLLILSESRWKLWTLFSGKK